MTTWNDKSGHARHGGFPGAGNRPLYGARSINEVIVPEWNNNQDWIDVSDSSFVSNRNITYVFVAVSDSFISNRVILGSTNVSMQLSTDASGQLHLRDQNGANILATQTNAAVTAGSPFVAACILSETTIQLRTNGVKQDFSESTVLGTGTLRLGGDNSLTGNRHDGLLAEVLVYFAQLTERQIAKTEDWLRQKWGF